MKIGWGFENNRAMLAQALPFRHYANWETYFWAFPSMVVVRRTRTWEGSAAHDGLNAARHRWSS